MWIALAATSMLPTRAVAWLAAAGAIACAAAPQPAPGSATIELAAARSMLASYPSDAVTLDPRLAVAESAPGVPSTERRDGAQTATLARELGARVATDRTGAGTYLILSAPVVRGDSAELTITAAWSRRDGGVVSGGYETRGLVLARTQGSWRVVRFQQLGIS
jgi:hypothetical protein